VGALRDLCYVLVFVFLLPPACPLLFGLEEWVAGTRLPFWLFDYLRRRRRHDHRRRSPWLPWPGAGPLFMFALRLPIWGLVNVPRRPSCAIRGRFGKAAASTPLSKVEPTE
jgi:hypothetical protein